MLTKLSPRRDTGPLSLVDLLGECHERIRLFLALARRAATRRDAPLDQVAQACADVERYFVEAYPLHVADEEESIAPRLRGLSPAVDDALEAMAKEHRQHAPKLDALLRATAQVQSEPHHDGARDELATTAEALQTEFEKHLVLEERAIFPAIRERLSAETQTRIVDELRQRRRHGRPQGNPWSTQEEQS
jgi:hemerythrin-like domain-containing protein